MLVPADAAAVVVPAGTVATDEYVIFSEAVAGGGGGANCGGGGGVNPGGFDVVVAVVDWFIVKVLNCLFMECADVEC